MRLLSAPIHWGPLLRPDFRADPRRGVSRAQSTLAGVRTGTETGGEFPDWGSNRFLCWARWLGWWSFRDALQLPASASCGLQGGQPSTRVDPSRVVMKIEWGRVLDPFARPSVGGFEPVPDGSSVLAEQGPQDRIPCCDRREGSEDESTSAYSPFEMGERCRDGGALYFAPAHVRFSIGERA